jgi:hypothetical protein
MQLAFLSLAIGNVALFVAIRKYLRGIWGRIGSFLFLVGAIGLVLAGIFVTDPLNTASDAVTTSGRLHNLGGTLGLAGFLGTLILSWKLIRNDAWRPRRSWVLLTLAVVIAGFLISFVSITSLTAQHAGVFGPDVPIGWPNRVGILAGCAWIMVIAWQATRIRPI